MSKAPLPALIVVSWRPETNSRSSDTSSEVITQRRLQLDRRDQVENDPPRWIRPVLLAVGLLPFVMTGFGLIAVTLRPVRQHVTEITYRPTNALVIEPAPNAAVEDVAAIPISLPIEPGEARPPLPGMQKPLPDEVTVSDAESAKETTLTVPVQPNRCVRFGTAIDFVRSPTIAFTQADKEQKLVLVLHLAGHFEDPGFT